jgi:hypothetical protein
MRRIIFIGIIATVFLALPLSSMAGVKLKIGEDTDVNLGFRLQTQYLSSDATSATDLPNSTESQDEFNVRRARIRLGGNITKWFSFFLQTEKGSGTGGSGYDMRLIDAFIKIKPHPLANFIIGENMAPAGRQITTSSGGLMAIDRPGITNYNLTWGLTGRLKFNNASYSDGDLALSNPEAVRDNGVTLFGSTSFSDRFHLKYYLGMYNGVQNISGEDNERYTTRVQFNFLDPEPGYYNLSTYVGKKKTIGIGFSYDSQDKITTDSIKGDIDYSFYEVDAFAELPVGPGTITAEAAFQDLDLDDATSLDDSSSITKDARETQGNGFYVQTGYLFNNWQPWVANEQWNSDAPDDTGSWDAWKVGLTYFVKGHNANIKLGYENWKSDQPFSGTEDTITTFLLGFYITY